MWSPRNSDNLYAGTDIGVFNSTDDGNTWNPHGAGLPRVAVFDLKVTPKRAVRIATHGRGLWEIAAISPGLAATTALSLTPSNPGNLVTLTAVVNHSSGSAAPTGTVVFVDSGTVLGFGPLSSAATATFLYHHASSRPAPPLQPAAPVTILTLPARPARYRSLWWLLTSP